jgi:hypothetical protein
MAICVAAEVTRPGRLLVPQQPRYLGCYPCEMWASSFSYSLAASVIKLLGITHRDAAGLRQSSCKVRPAPPAARCEVPAAYCPASTPGNVASNALSWLGVTPG